MDRPHHVERLRGQDLYLLKSDGSTERLTYAPGDDNSPSWAPDGSRIVYETAQWNQASHYDLAIRDMRTGATRQLTSGDPEDQVPRWSPDGTRIAFTRSYFDGTPRHVCWVGVDGSRRTCSLLPGVAVGGTLGWRDDRRLVVQADSAGTVAVRLLDVLTGEATAVPIPETQALSLSQGGTWLLLRGLMRNTSRVSWWVAPLADPLSAREIPVPVAGSRVLWGRVPRQRPFLQRLVIKKPVGPVPVGLAYQLSAEGRDASGHPIPAWALSWRSSDAAIAGVDSGGLVTPHRAGAVTVYASAGGWRADSIRLRAAPATDSVTLREAWSGGLEAWVPFGDPRPEVVSVGRGSHALWNKGDSAYTSGVYSRGAWPAAAGLGVETVLRAPVTEVQWQKQTIALEGALDSTALGTWDHRTGSLDSRRSPPEANCTVLFPDQQGPPASARIAALNESELARFTAPPDMRAGAPHRLRIQIFPDGRCGVALDGRAMFVSHSSVSLDRPFRLVLSGMSHHTRVLVGAVDVWRGVRPDVDWSRADSAAVRH